jgi:hypothetical protein
MPTRFPGYAPAGTIETLGLPTRAVTALTRAGITDVAALSALTRRELTAVPGLGAGLVTAIRRIVPEPPAALPRAGAPDDGQLPLPAEDDGAPPAPAIPSFASLRDPRRRTAFDLLVPEAPAAQEPAADPDADPAGDPDPDPQSQVEVEVEAGNRPAVGGAGPRPAEYADLLRFGIRLARAAAAVPGRVAVWSVRTPVDCVRRLLGG